MNDNERSMSMKVARPSPGFVGTTFRHLRSSRILESFSVCGRVCKYGTLGSIAHHLEGCRVKNIGCRRWVMGIGTGFGKGVIMDRIVKVGDCVNVRLRVEDVGGRRRRVSGGLDVEGDIEDIWDVITDYVGMERYMPNILESKVWYGDEEARNLYLEQVGLISRRLGLKSRMVMRVREREKEWIRFSRVEGRDFTEFEGEYKIRNLEGAQGRCRLEYEVFAVPMPFFPVALVERKIVKEVPLMLAAIREEVLARKVVSSESGNGTGARTSIWLPRRKEGEEQVRLR